MLSTAYRYVAVQSGWGVDAQKMQVSLDEILGYTTHVPQEGVLWVFGLKGAVPGTPARNPPKNSPSDSPSLIRVLKRLP